MSRCFRTVLAVGALAGSVHGLDCTHPGFSIMADMHDGDQKKAALVQTDNHDGLSLVITPHNNTQTWKVTTAWNNVYCNASVDFRVPGKPNPPPVALEMSYFLGEGGEGKPPRYFAVFTDPSGTLAPSSAPLNTWVAVSSGPGVPAA
jgi:hypothetical protein